MHCNRVKIALLCLPERGSVAKQTFALRCGLTRLELHVHMTSKHANLLSNFPQLFKSTKINDCDQEHKCQLCGHTLCLTWCRA